MRYRAIKRKKGGCQKLGVDEWERDEGAQKIQASKLQRESQGCNAQHEDYRYTRYKLLRR